MSPRVFWVVPSPHDPDDVIRFSADLESQARAEAAVLHTDVRKVSR